MINSCKETYTPAPMVTNNQLTMTQSNQAQFFFNLHIIRQRYKEGKRSVDTIPVFFCRFLYSQHMHNSKSDQVLIVRLQKYYMDMLISIFGVHSLNQNSSICVIDPKS
jgi:hypothetical protein